MSFTLPIRLPWWARALGLQMDWQSRPWHRTRTYHSRDRDLEVTVGRGSGWWALEVSRYDEHTNLHLGVPGVNVFWKIGRGATPPIGEMAVSWGAYTFEWGLWLSWGAWSRSFDLNPFRWDGYKSERLRADGQWDSTEIWKHEAKEIDWYVETHPYAIASEPTYYAEAQEPSFSIETWEAEATCHIHRTTRTRRWISWWPKVEFYVDVRLDDEIGPRKGSWKGGTVGFSRRMLPGDRVADVLQRAAREGRGR